MWKLIFESWLFHRKFFFTTEFERLDVPPSITCDRHESFLRGASSSDVAFCKVLLVLSLKSNDWSQRPPAWPWAREHTLLCRRGFRQLLAGGGKIFKRQVLTAGRSGSQRPVCVLYGTLVLQALSQLLHISLHLFSHLLAVAENIGRTIICISLLKLDNWLKTGRVHNGSIL